MSSLFIAPPEERRDLVEGIKTRVVSEVPVMVAPSGAEVRPLARCDRGGMAHFRLPAGRVSRAVVYRTVEEIWYLLEGSGQLWRHLPTHSEETVQMRPGVSVSPPVGTAYQFRADPDAPLAIVGVTTPPWPGDGEAEQREGISIPTV
jgi:mannose-6-phosphate isomerase-like protein (cupin superfamily)